MAAPPDRPNVNGSRDTLERCPRDTAVERVTGIEPAQSAWKAWFSERCLGWSAPSQVDAVPSACLSTTLGGRKSGSSQRSVTSPLVV